MTRLTELSEGTKIGYHPIGADDTRQVGIVKSVDASTKNITVTLPDDPEIEERVPFNRVESVEGGGE